MKLFSMKFQGVWLGGCAVVLADDQDEAVELLQIACPGPFLMANATGSGDIEIQEIDMATKQAIILDNGDY